MKYIFLTLFLFSAMPAFACEAHEKAAAQNAHAMHGNHMMSASKQSGAASTAAYEKAMNAMHKDMMIEYSGNADVDFARGMIPHHQGAVEMAKIELMHGKDPEMRKLAEEVIKAQETEIKFMRAWLQKHDKH